MKSFHLQRHLTTNYLQNNIRKNGCLQNPGIQEHFSALVPQHDQHATIDALVPYLFQKGVISFDMMKDIKVKQTSWEKIEYFLNSMKEIQSGYVDQFDDLLLC